MRKVMASPGEHKTMGFLMRPPRHPDPTDHRADFIGHHSDTPLALTDPRLPEPVRRLGQQFGADLACVLRNDTDQGIEWWLMSHEDELLEAIWFE
jgi:hypothetical protein